LPFVLQHQHRDAGHGLGHRRDPEHGVGRHGSLRRDVRETVGLEVQHGVLVDDHRDSARDLLLGDHVVHRCADAGQLRAGLLCECRQSGRNGNCGGKSKALHARDPRHADEM
jgi:hypothetical protein